ncbi:MAG: hypothetical protein AB8B99_08825 [Phormidesmis sp.]
MNSMLMPPTTMTDDVSKLSQESSDAEKYITFKLADYLFALPSNKILKVVTTPSPNQGGMVSMGLVQLEQYSIQTLDLPKMMSLQVDAVDTSGLDLSKTIGERAPSSQVLAVDRPQKSGTLDQGKNPPFLIVLQDADGTLWGIAVNEPPDLMDIPQYALKPVPSEKRLTRTLRWVSHVVTYDLEGDRHTLLVLDLSVLFSTQPFNAPAEGKMLLEIEPPCAEESSVEVDAATENPLGIEPPLELADLEVASDSGRKEEMYA